MGYLHINNLYKDQTILLFKKCYALEKIHGTSAHIKWKYCLGGATQLTYFSGGEKHDNFVKLFNNDNLLAQFQLLFPTTSVTIFGEAYGGKQQGMSHTYGKELKFIAFDVQLNDKWLNVPDAQQICTLLGIEFVHYDEIHTEPGFLDVLCNTESVQAIRNGVGNGHIREGIVLRPLVEMILNNGERVIAKHKNEKFKEREHQPKLKPGQSLEILQEAEKIAQEWVTEMRLTHLIDKIPANIEHTGDIIKAMIEDIYREAKDEIVENPEVKKAIGKRTALLFKQRLKGV